MKINNINILQEQINLKLENNIKNILKILQDYKGDDWKLYQNNNIKTDYIRNKVYSNKYFEIILISWGPNSKSKIHDHSKNGCAFKVLQGELVEYLYNKKLDLINNKNYLKNDISYIDNNIGYHKIINNTKNIVHSIHIYSPPNYISQMK